MHEVAAGLQAAGLTQEEEGRIIPRDIRGVEETRMASEDEAARPVLSAERKALIKLAMENNAKAGIAHDPTATGQKARELMLAQGIRPEDNLFSRDIIRSKYPDEEIEEPMRTTEQPAAPAIIQPVERRALIELAKEINAKAGIVHDPSATSEKVREMMLAAGIRPEENILSRDIIRAKYPDEEDGG
jgi:hypothetical protein